MHNAGYLEKLTPVSGFRIQKDAAGISLKAKYDAKYGAPSAGNPKVFIKYFFVNAATGEKFGKKMASAVLSNG